MMKWEEPSVMILAGLLLMQVIAGVVGNGTPRTHPYLILNDPQADRSRPLNADFDNMEVSINESVHIWPMPASVTKGMAIVTLARDFAFGQADGNQIVSATLAQAFSRYIDIIYRPHALSQVASSSFQDSNIPVLEQLLVSLDPSTEEVIYIFIYFCMKHASDRGIAQDLKMMHFCSNCSGAAVLTSVKCWQN